MPFLPFSDHFQSNHGQTYIFLHILIYFNFFSLRPHPPLIQKAKRGGGGHALLAYSFSYWDTPTSAQKGGGGGMCLKCPPPRSTYEKYGLQVKRLHISTKLLLSERSEPQTYVYIKIHGIGIRISLSNIRMRGFLQNVL